jgi:hypothetical protein
MAKTAAIYGKQPAVMADKEVAAATARKHREGSLFITPTLSLGAVGIPVPRTAGSRTTSYDSPKASVNAFMPSPVDLPEDLKFITLHLWITLGAQCATNSVLPLLILLCPASSKERGVITRELSK